VGVGQTVTALYEIALYEERLSERNGKVATVKVRGRDGASGEIREFAKTIAVDEVDRPFEKASERFRFTAAVAEFAEILKESQQARPGSLEEVLRVAASAKESMNADSKDEEFVSLVKVASECRAAKVELPSEERGRPGVSGSAGSKQSTGMPGNTQSPGTMGTTCINLAGAWLSRLPILLACVVLLFSILRVLSRRSMRRRGASLLSKVRVGDYGAVKRLIAKGVAVDTADEYGRTALMIAIECDQREIAKLLIESGANLEHRDSKKMTAAILAAYEGRSEILELLVQSKACVDVQDDRSWSALMWAALNGNERITSLLIDNGARVSLKSEDGWTAYQLALGAESEETAKLIAAAGGAD
jgi:uncharacterized protein